MNVAGNIITILFALSLISCGRTAASIQPPRDVRATSSPSVNRANDSPLLKPFESHEDARFCANLLRAELVVRGEIVGIRKQTWEISAGAEWEKRTVDIVTIRISRMLKGEWSQPMIEVAQRDGSSYLRESTAGCFVISRIATVDGAFGVSMVRADNIRTAWFDDRAIHHPSVTDREILSFLDAHQRYYSELAEATRGIFSWSRIRDRNITVDLHITGWKRPGQVRAESIDVTEEWKPQSKYRYFTPLLTHESRERVGGLSFDPCYSSIRTSDDGPTLERTDSDDEIKYRGMNNRQEHVELTIDKSTGLMKEYRFANDIVDIRESFIYTQFGQRQMLSKDVREEKELCKSPYDTITMIRTFEYTTIDGLLLPAKVVTSELRKPRPEIKWEEKMETIEYTYANYRIEPVAK